MALAPAIFAALLALSLGPDSSSDERAPDDPNAPGDPIEEPTGAPDIDGSEAAAKQAFDEGLTAVASGEYEVAVAAFERAHELRPHPVTLFNLALALEKVERLPEAWGLFEHIADLVHSDAEHREIRRHMQELEEQIAIVEFDARPRSRLCIDGLDVPPAEGTDDYRLAVDAGRHELLLDEHAITVELEAGERRVLLLDHPIDVASERRHGRVVPGMLGTAIGLGAAAAGLGVGAALTNDGLQTGLAVGAAGSAGVAMVFSVVALVVEARARSSKVTPVESKLVCPGAPGLEGRLDLQFGPAGARAVEHSWLRDRPPPFARPRPVEIARPFPHPHGLVPPRHH